MVTTIVNASTHTIARLNGARPEPQIMYVFLSFFSLFFRLLMIFLHLDYMYRVDDDNERPPHRTHNPLSGQPPHYTMHHHVTPWHYHRQRVHPHETTNYKKKRESGPVFGVWVPNCVFYPGKLFEQL